MDYSKDPSPVEMLANKIILPNLVTDSAYQRLTIGLVLSHWVDRHYRKSLPGADKSDVPIALKSKLLEHLGQVWTLLNTDTGA